MVRSNQLLAPSNPASLTANKEGVSSSRLHQIGLTSGCTNMHAGPTNMCGRLELKDGLCRDGKFIAGHACMSVLLAQTRPGQMLIELASSCALIFVVPVFRHRS